MKKYIRLSAITALISAGTFLLSACASSADSTDVQTIESTPAPVIVSSDYAAAENTITVNSSEKVTVTPDIAEVIYAVRTEAKDAAACQKKNSEDVNKVIELLKGLGLAETSIQTSDYHMYPIYNYSGNTQKITGYESTTALTVADIPIGDLGNILEQSVSAGINNIQSITYQSSKYDEGYNEALKLAVASAKRKAEVLAEAGSCSIGSVVGIYENSRYSEARYTDNALASKMRQTTNSAELAYDESTASIMPGEVDIEVNITVEYSILY